MEVLKKYSTVILIAVILFLIVTLLVKNNAIDKNAEKIKSLETELKIKKEDTGKEDTDKEDTKSTDTFDEDLKWFLSKVYETNNRLQLYEDIKDSVNQDVLTALLGDEIPPKENALNEESVDREVTNIDVYGKYGTEGKFKAVVLFDVSYKFKDQEDSKQILAYIEITNQKGSWIITEFEEIN